MDTKKDTNTQNFPVRKIPTWVIAVFPLVLLAGLIALFVNTNPIQVTTSELPPIEDLSFQRVNLTRDHIEIKVTNSGPDQVVIAQIIIDEAYWNFEIDPYNSLGRLESATIHMDYPWVETEPFEIVIITSSGTTFAHEVELATESPTANAQQFLAYGLVGLYVGIIPVGLGLLWFPALRRMSQKGIGFVLALTVGLLVFLLVDTFLEAIEVAHLLPGVFQGIPLTLFAAILTWLIITAIGSQQTIAERSSPRGRKFIASLIATGIGFHNLGEGLVVGAAFALGEAALGSFLVIGFILHNITEGIGIAAPVTRDKPGLSWFTLMLFIAGGPAILGTWIGGFAFSPLLAVIFLGVGLGAIWQVIFEVGLLMQRDAQKENISVVNWVNVLGLAIGIALMYFTAFLVKF
ncbi:MAG: metal transporter [Chloroflexi bacterium]|nr:metal transporter [Chloroflexota bacterium]